MTKKRIFYAVVGVAVMLFAGFVYAWSILSAPIAADFPQWTNAQLSLTFTICMAFFCLGGMAAGMFSKRIPVRVNVMISAALFLVGFFLTSRAQSLSLLYVSYGVLCGTASGFAYNSVMNVMPRWFPDRQGLISGVLLMGFGASSMIIGSAFTSLTPAVPGAWRSSLLFMGILMAVILLIGSFFFLPPKEGEAPASPSKKGASGEQGLELTPVSMIRRPSFWCFFLWATLLSAAGLVIIGQARALAMLAIPSFTPSAISFVVGFISICNGLGRVIFGACFDRWGRKTAMLVVTCSMLLGIVSLALSLFLVLPDLLVAGFVLTGLGYGGGPTMSAAFTKRFYGEQNYAVNFSITNVNLLVASFASTAAGAIYDRMGTYSAVFILLFLLLALAYAFLFAIRRP
ncbi:MAG: MFS transporter [Clostridia bacterium]|nr:MFS transporter [Clostridia bacterium]